MAIDFVRLFKPFWNTLVKCHIIKNVCDAGAGGDCCSWSFPSFNQQIMVVTNENHNDEKKATKRDDDDDDAGTIN